MNEDHATNNIRSPSTHGLNVLAARLAEEMEERWSRGERPTADQYLTLYPKLQDHPAAAVSLIHEEVCLRQENGEGVDYKSILSNYPQWRTQLAFVLDCHQLLRDEVTEIDWPELREEFLEYRILTELGRGGLGRVYLAQQHELAERLVVLKVSKQEGNEHLSLARLQHTAIVPLYAVHQIHDAGLRCLCMPWFGGLTFEDIHQELRFIPFSERTGEHLAVLATRLPDGVPESETIVSPTRTFLASLSYSKAICWMGSVLADALHHAHERGLVHLDVKLGNVLIAGDGQPMLLDFHLSRSPLKGGETAVDIFGGTAAYMAPEHRAALQAIKSQQSVPSAVDGRADIFGLGLTLYQMLGGTNLLPQSSHLPPLAEIDPDCSPGLSDIIEKCLADDPNQRYATASALAMDLRCHVSDMPLREVRNRSVRERWEKWRRRSPMMLSFLMMIIAVLSAALTLGIIGISHIQHRQQQALQSYHDGLREFANQDYESAKTAFERSHSLSQGVGADEQLAHQAKQQAKEADYQRMTKKFHQLMEQMRQHYDGKIGQSDDAMKQIHHWRQSIDWKVRSKEVGFRESQLRRDLLDFGIIWADWLVSKNEPERALQLLQETEEIYGRPSRVIAMIRNHATKQSTKIDHVQPETAWEMSVLGRTLMKQKQWEKAARWFERAMELQPNRYWSHLYFGICAYQQQQLEDANRAFTVCIALAPTRASGWLNRGFVFESQKKLKKAVSDYTRALECDNELASAYLHRGAIYQQFDELDLAVNDLHKALHRGARGEVVYTHLAEIYHKQGKNEDAQEQVRRALSVNPNYPPALRLQQTMKSSSCEAKLQSTIQSHDMD